MSRLRADRSRRPANLGAEDTEQEIVSCLGAPDPYSCTLSDLGLRNSSSATVAFGMTEYPFTLQVTGIRSMKGGQEDEDDFPRVIDGNGFIHQFEADSTNNSPAKRPRLS